MGISPQQITDVITLQDMFTRAGTPYDPQLLADIIEWAEHRDHVHVAQGVGGGVVKMGEPIPGKALGDKETESSDSDEEPF